MEQITEQELEAIQMNIINNQYINKINRVLKHINFELLSQDENYIYYSYGQSRNIMIDIDNFKSTLKKYKIINFNCEYINSELYYSPDDNRNARINRIMNLCFIDINGNEYKNEFYTSQYGGTEFNSAAYNDFYRHVFCKYDHRHRKLYVTCAESIDLCKPIPIFDPAKNIPIHFIKRLDMYYNKEFKKYNHNQEKLELKLDINKLRKDIEEYKKSEQEKLELNKKLIEANEQITKLKLELEAKTNELNAYTYSIDL